MKTKSPRLVSRHPMPLAAYLTGVVGSSLLVSAPQADAAVTAVTFPVSVLNQSSGMIIGYTTPNFEGGYITMYGHPNRVGLDRIYHNADLGLGSFYGSPKFFANGAILGAGAGGTRGIAYFFSIGYGVDLPSQLNKNIGFRTQTNNFGWANVSWDATAKELTFNSAYLESVPGNTITVGDVGAVPEPSRALLALAGFGAVALRRRRKQAA